jgi:regulatory protein YycI of two-component signal transduction system YycFG
LSSREESLLEILEKALPLPPKIIVGYNKLERDFTSGDVSRVCDISRSSAKFYVNKMVDLRLVTKVPHKRMYQKFANANKFSDWLKDLQKLALEPLENGSLEIIDDMEDYE